MITFSLYSFHVKQAHFAYVTHVRLRFWKQPVLINERKVSCSRKQREPLMGLELTSDMHTPIASKITLYKCLKDNVCNFYNGKYLACLTFMFLIIQIC
mgnify:CR=1 FL=1